MIGVLVHFPAEKTGQKHKLLQSWHGLYQVIAKNDPDITVAKVYFLQHGNIQVHQSRIQRCPLSVILWYGDRRGPGWPAKWIVKLLSDGLNSSSEVEDDADKNAISL